MQPDTIPGDVVFVLHQKEHPKFNRKSDDLYVEHSLSLTEALCGFQFLLTHLDGRQLLIKSNPGEIIKPGNTRELPYILPPLNCTFLIFSVFMFPRTGQYKAINDEGMPHHQRPFIKGRLFIHFNVDFPDSGFLSPDKCRDLEAVLPSKPGKQLSDKEVDECEETTLHDVNMEEEMRRKEHRRQSEAYDDEDDDDDEPTMHRMPCNQQ